MDFGAVMLLEFERSDSDQTYVERHHPEVFHSVRYQNLCRAVNSDTFERATDALVVLNMIVIYVQTRPLLAGDPSITENPSLLDGQIDTIWELFETCFTVLYAIEMFLKILVKGRRRFWSSFRNRFDAAVVLLAVTASAYVYYPNSFSDSRVIRYIVLIRVLRVSRLLVVFQDFRVLWSSLVTCLPKASRVGLLLFCAAYCFSALGMLLFGGLINRDPDDPTSAYLVGTDFERNYYW
mmetsp:Transcript_5079/g.10243  ORF Transcript_5079/g.10243 Transcript_5079/m.10243 type:complete len:237 (-) Transcript_5079:618-1328(-)